MKLIKNSGDDRVVDALRSSLATLSTLDVASPAFSAFAYGELRELLGKIAKCRIVLPDDQVGDLSLLGSSSDRPFRNRLQARWLARQCHHWVEKYAEVRTLPGIMPQSTLIAGRLDSSLTRVITGNCAFTTEGLGITPGNQFSLIQSSESPEECSLLGSWFTALWNGLPASPEAKRSLLARLVQLFEHKEPSLIYYLTLFHLFKNLGDELDEDKIESRVEYD